MPTEFVIPGANRASAALDLARTIVRRAERLLVSSPVEGSLVGPLPQPPVRPAVGAWPGGPRARSTSWPAAAPRRRPTAQGRTDTADRRSTADDLGVTDVINVTASAGSRTARRPGRRRRAGLPRTDGAGPPGGRPPDVAGVDAPGGARRRLVRAPGLHRQGGPDPGQLASATSRLPTFAPAARSGAGGPPARHGPGRARGPADLSGDAGLETVRRAAAAFVRAAGKGGTGRLLLPEVGRRWRWTAAAEAVAEGASLATYRYDDFRTAERPGGLAGWCSSPVAAPTPGGRRRRRPRGRVAARWPWPGTWSTSRRAP